MTPIYEIYVRRDAYTITPSQVPAYEVPILQTIFGEENVLNANRRLIAEGMGEPVGHAQPGEDEFARLASRYGGNEKGLYVEQVYGIKAAGNLARAVNEAQVGPVASPAEPVTDTHTAKKK